MSHVIEGKIENANRQYGIITHVSNYRVLSELGAGAYGQVFLVTEEDENNKDIPLVDLEISQCKLYAMKVMKKINYRQLSFNYERN